VCRSMSLSFSSASTNITTIRPWVRGFFDMLIHKLLENNCNNHHYNQDDALQLFGSCHMLNQSIANQHFEMMMTHQKTNLRFVSFGQNSLHHILKIKGPTNNKDDCFACLVNYRSQASELQSEKARDHTTQQKKFKKLGEIVVTVTETASTNPNQQTPSWTLANLQQSRNNNNDLILTIWTI
jgi:hypothetical protein